MASNKDPIAQAASRVGESLGLMLTRRDFTRFTLSGAATLLAIAPLFATLPACTETKPKREITDMGGRKVSIPQEVSRLLCTNPIGTVDVYLLDPALLVGWNFKPQAADAAFLDEGALELPSLGVWMGAGSVPNGEEVLARSPDVLLCFWSTDEAGIGMADAIAAEMRLPVLLCDCDIRKVAETYRFLGEVLGIGGADDEGTGSTKSDAEETGPEGGTAALSERLGLLRAYFSEMLSLIEDVVSRIPEAQRKSVYLSEGKGGLQTDPVGSLQVQDALDLLKTKNVVELPGSEGQGMGMPSVSIEQIITWDPDAVLVSEYSMSDTAKSDLYNEIRADANWQNVPCVKAGEVYQIPQSPFSWFGRPPSAMRLLGCLWLLERLYPEQAAEAGIDLAAQTRRFFATCLGYELSDADIKMLLKE
ncbi:MAG: ABC transporter substrate-binding protein [Coriobacteriaceae bacterium]|jgi:iron complex transport system substrate-binding protein|nr:ABC transporter substrate-binding protein [Coriobacteriaceae bacterium]